jgi:hypothetical protein
MLAIMSAVAQPTPSFEIFFSYSHEDETLRKALDAHLSELWRSGVVRWYDRQIGPGSEWEGQIDEHLASARIILLLISRSFLASDYCYDIEMKRALERHARGEAIVIPILLRPIAWWKRSPFRKLQCLPRNGKPVTEWRTQDTALAEVAEEIIKVIDQLLGDEEPAAIWPRFAVPRTWLWIRRALIAATAAGLIALGVRERLPWLAPPAKSTPGKQARINLVFAVGSSIAMAGQSTQNAGNEVFHRALAELRFEPGAIEGLDAEYAALRGERQSYGEFEQAKLRLMRRVGASLPSSEAAAAEFAHDLTALQLLLRYWARYPPADALHVAHDQVARLQRSASAVALPAAVAARIRALDDVNLIQSEYRGETERLLDEAMLQFDKAPPN